MVAASGAPPSSSGPPPAAAGHGLGRCGTVGANIPALRTLLVASAAGFGLHAAVDRLGAGHGGVSALQAAAERFSWWPTAATGALGSAVGQGLEVPERAAPVGAAGPAPVSSRRGVGPIAVPPREEADSCANHASGILGAARHGPAMFQRTLQPTAGVVADDPAFQPKASSMMEEAAPGLTQVPLGEPVVSHVREARGAGHGGGEFGGGKAAGGEAADGEAGGGGGAAAAAGSEVAAPPPPNQEMPVVSGAMNGTFGLPWEVAPAVTVVRHDRRSEAEGGAPPQHDIFVPVPLFRHTRTDGVIADLFGNDLVGDALDPKELSHHEHHHSYYGLVFLCGSLAWGVAILWVIERYLPMIPYTCALFAAGLLASATHHFSYVTEKRGFEPWRWDSWYISVDMWDSIDPHMLFFAFLPALLFGEAMRLSVQLASSSFWQVFLLACPGVLMTCALTGSVAKYLLPYGWDWPISLVFGAILAATDPVAVVALFNTLGVSPRLTMLISGESLMNDGTAIVVFTLMLKLALGAEITRWSAASFVVHMCFASVVFGIMAGYLSVFVIGVCAEEHYQSDSMIQVIVTICCGYLCFFFAESELGTSGVLATVSGGVVLAHAAWPRFVSRETMTTIWEAVEFIGNTVVFFLAGMMFGEAMFKRRDYIGLEDFGWLLVIFACVTLIRACVILFLWVPLNFAGTPLHWSEGLVMVWSGLRGAVSLALAIIVDTKPETTKAVGSKVMFHVGGIAALTFLVNATTMSWCLRMLGITATSSTRKDVLRSLADHARADTKTEFQEMMAKKDDVCFAGAVPEVVRAMVPALVDEEEPLSPQWATPGGLSPPRLDRRTTSQVQHEVERECLKIYRDGFLRVVRHHYLQAIQEGIIPRTMKVTRILLASVEEALANASLKLSDWDCITRHLAQENSEKPGIISKIAADVVECWPLRLVPEFRRTFSSDFVVMRKVYAALNFQDAHRRAREEMPRYFSGTDSGMNEQIQNIVAEESLLSCRKAADLLELVPADIIELGSSEMLARRLLQRRMDKVVQLQHKGLLTASECSTLEHQVTLAFRKIVNEPKAFWQKAKYAMSPQSETKF